MPRPQEVTEMFSLHATPLCNELSALGPKRLTQAQSGSVLT